MLDRRRLVKIEALADEVLRGQEQIVEMERQRNGRREGLGVFRRKESGAGAQWIASEGQFLRLPAPCAKAWLERRQEATLSSIEAGRAEMKSRTHALLTENPHIAEMPAGVRDLLLQPLVPQTDPAAAVEAEAAAAAEAKLLRETKRAKNILDYSRFDRMCDSDDSDSGRVK